MPVVCCNSRIRYRRKSFTWYRSGTSETMRRHLAEIAGSALAIVVPTQHRVLDIGCNDGTLPREIPGRFERWGIDPFQARRTHPFLVPGIRFGTALRERR
jgi:hypothetical protein